MVVKCRYAVVFQPVGNLACLLAVSCINDCGTRCSLEDIQNGLILVFRIGDKIFEVLTLKTHPLDIGRREQQFVLNVADYLWRCGCRYGQNGFSWEDVADVGYLQIGGAEVVSPL